MVRAMIKDKEKDLPKRKNNRLKNYDYSSSGAYFITICTKDRKILFWNKPQLDFASFVGEEGDLPPSNTYLSAYGKIAQQAIEESSSRYSHVKLL